MRWQARCRADAERTARTGWVVIRSASRSSFLFEHDLFGKPDSTFPDHALGAPGELVGNLTCADWRLRRPMPPMMRRALPSTWRKLRANCRLLPRRNVAMHLFRTVWPWQA